MWSWFRKKSPEPVEDEIEGVVMRRNLDDVQTFFLMVTDDGGLTREGTGALDDMEPVMFMAGSDPDAFEAVRKRITPELLKWCGQSPESHAVRGKVVELSIQFGFAGDKEEVIEWRYGTESEGPPAVIERFVAAAIRASDPWYQEQLRMHRQG